jgi:urease accessory protein
MSDPQKLQRLLAFMSPSFPVGGFAWSAGLEAAIAEGFVIDAETTRNWLEGLLHHAGLHTDAILLCEAHRNAADAFHLAELAELCLALTAARERQAELRQMGDAFVKATAAWPVKMPAPLPAPCPYPIAVGAIAAVHGIDIYDTVLAFLTAQVQAQISVAVRLVPIGQIAGLEILVALEADIAALANSAQTATLDDIGTIAYAADIAQMRHETLPTRIFRS